MLYIIIGTAVLFVAIGFLVTKNNAKYLFSGYNTMSNKEREKFDIKSYIPFFRNFHIGLGISLLFIGLLLHYVVHEAATGIFICIYPILAYIYFIWQTNTYWKGSGNKWNKISIYILLGAFIFIVGLLLMGYKENQLIITADTIEFNGMYGEKLRKTEIRSVDLVNELPNIQYKANGFALGAIRKGFFRTNTGENIKLLLHSDNINYLLVTKVNGEKIYFSAKEKSSKSIYAKINKSLANNTE